MMLSDLARALAQLTDPRFLWIAVKSVLLTIALLVAASLGFGWFVGWLLPDTISLPVIGDIGRLDEALSIAAVPAMLLLSAFLMIPVAAVFLGFFLDDVADAVDRRHYPNLPPVKPVSTLEILVDAVRFALVFLAVNGVALVIYLLSTLLAPVIFWIVNGYLLGREIFQQVALRRMTPTAAHGLRRRNRLQVWLMGILLTIPMTVPILNLVMPMVAVAAFTHMVERLRR